MRTRRPPKTEADSDASSQTKSRRPAEHVTSICPLALSHTFCTCQTETAPHSLAIRHIQIRHSLISVASTALPRPPPAVSLPHVPPPPVHAAASFGESSRPHPLLSCAYYATLTTRKRLRPQAGHEDPSLQRRGVRNIQSCLHHVCCSYESLLPHHTRGPEKTRARQEQTSCGRLGGEGNEEKLPQKTSAPDSVTHRFGHREECQHLLMLVKAVFFHAEQMNCIFKCTHTLQRNEKGVANFRVLFDDNHPLSLLLARQNTQKGQARLRRGADRQKGKKR